MAIDDSIRSLKADDAVVKERLRTSEIGVREMQELLSLVQEGKVGSAMVHENDLSSAQAKLQRITVFGNAKVPRGYIAAYDTREKLIGFYSLAA